MDGDGVDGSYNGLDDVLGPDALLGDGGWIWMVSPVGARPERAVG